MFAGKGTDTEIRDKFRPESDYNIQADEWAKVSGEGYIIMDGKVVLAELHWYEADGEIYEMKVRHIGKSDASLTNGKVYEVLSIEETWYGIVDNTDEDFCFHLMNLK